MRRISIFGSTGSIGCNTVDLIERDRASFKTIVLSGGRNVAKLAAQARLLNAEIAITAYDECLPELRDALANTDIEVAAGKTALLEAAERSADWVMSAIVGAAGLAPGLKALEQGATLALANKESLVAAGPLLMQTAKDNRATILPVDSEHSGVFQALNGEDKASVERVIITASGGAFRDWPIERMAGATPEEALEHPNWSMGQRITIDSASMFNKALELIETKEFFNLPASSIEAVIHPESLIHAMVGFNDGSLLAHIGPHDMRHAIGYALNWPDRRPLPLERLDFAKIGSLSFQTPDETRYPALRLARYVMEAGGLTGAVFNAAKETALDAFIEKRIGFLEMAQIVEAVIENLTAESLGIAAITLESVREADQMARMAARQLIEKEAKVTNG